MPANPQAASTSPVTMSLASPKRGTSRRIRPPCTTALKNPIPAKANAAVRASQCIRRSKKSANVPSNAAKATTARKPTRMSRPIPGIEIVSTIPRQLDTRAASRAGSTRWPRLGKADQDEHPRQGRKTRGHQERQSEPPVVGQRQAEEHSRPGEARARIPARKPCRSIPCPAPVLRRRHVGDIRLRDQDVAPRSTVQEPRQEHHA